MQKNEFEKQMQQKMDELKIPPSEAVWQNVEAAITKTKRRKWGWLVLLLLFTGSSWAVYLWYPGLHSGKNRLANKAEASLEKNERHNFEKAAKTQLTKKIFTRIPLLKEDLSTNIKTIKPGKKQFLSQLIRKNNDEQTRSTEKLQKIKRDEISLKNLQEDREAASKSNKTFITVERGQKKTGKDSIWPKEENKIIGGEGAPISSTPVNNDTTLVAAIITGTADKEQPQKNKSNPNGSGKNKAASTKKLWEWGVSFSAGISGVPQSFLGSLDKTYSRADALYANIPSMPTGQVLLPSKIESSPAFTAGFFGEKNLSKKITFTLGLFYKKFSSTNKIGVRNDSLLGYNLANPVNTYNNYYHFLEIPVSLKVQPVAKIPLFWEAGISLSRLIGSNALQFNNAAQVYQINNRAFNKTQVGFNAGLAASFFSKQKISLLIGPQIYYGTTKIAPEGLYKNQHFTFIGVRSQILLKNKNQCHAFYESIVNPKNKQHEKIF